MKEIRLTNRISIIIAWYDFWIGGYYNQKKKQLYLMILSIGLVIKFKPTEEL